eukprot:scaffold586950_cov37-Prasinocladus_malaysianus.AAC.1
MVPDRVIVAANELQDTIYSWRDCAKLFNSDDKLGFSMKLCFEAPARKDGNGNASLRCVRYVKPLQNSRRFVVLKE